MKATVCVHSCQALSDTELTVAFHVSLSNGNSFDTDARVAFSPSATTLNNAIRSKVISASPEHGGTGLQNSDISIFGGVS